MSDSCPICGNAMTCQNCEALQAECPCGAAVGEYCIGPGAPWLSHAARWSMLDIAVGRARLAREDLGDR